MANEIYRLVPAAEYCALPEGQPYLPPGFAEEGFIHFTGNLDLLLAVANRFYAQALGEMWTLVIDPTRVAAPIRWEPPAHPAGAPPPETGDALFPHIYGPLNRDAVVGVRIARRDANGHFYAL